MAAVRIDPRTPTYVWLTAYVVLVTLGGSLVFSQAPPGIPPQDQIVELRIRGNHRVPSEKIIPHIRTRAGRPYDPDAIEKDVRRLYQTRKFVKVNALTQDVEGGKIVIFELLERPVIEYVKVTGNEKIRKKTLLKEIGLKTGDGMDPYAVEEGRRKLLDYYHSKGFSKVFIEIAEGDQPNDRGVVYVINEGPKQRVLWTEFIGNSIADDAHLRTVIKSKPGFLWIFKGEVDRKQIDEDINRLTDYYHSLGFFNVRVGRPILDFNDEQDWLTLRFVIDEGPRYKVRSVRLVGNKIFSTEEITQEFKLKAGKYFNRAEMTADAAMMADLYGGEGYIFTKVEPDIRLGETPGELDLVYSIKESERYRVGKIMPEIKGEYPHTKISTVLNRLSLRPGDIVDTRELRASERRLKASGLFRVDPAMNIAPKINIVKSESDLEGAETAQRPQRTAPREGPRRPGGYRGQSPDEPARCVRAVDLVVEGEWIGPSESDELPAAMPAPQASPAEDDPVLPAARAESRRALPSDVVIRGQSPDSGLDTSGWSPAPATRLEQPAPSPTSVPAAPSATSAPATLPATSGLRWGVPLVREGGAQSAVSSGTDTWPGRGPQTPAARSPLPWSPESARRAAATSQYRPPEVLRGQNTYDAGGGFLSPSLASPVPAFDTRPQPVTPTADPRPPMAGSALLPGPVAEGPVAPGGVVVAPGAVPPDYGRSARPETTVPRNAPFAAEPSVRPQAFQDPEALLGRPPNEEPPLYVPLQPELEETQTGRFLFSVGVNSDLGVVGSFVIDEQNFDWTRLPRSWEDIRNATAFRGAGERFRFEAMPGTQVQRYTINFTEPYLLDTRVSLGLSGHYYERRFYEWDESRAGGRVALGYQFVPDLSGTLTYRGENVKVFNPIVPPGVIPDLDEVLGASTLHGFRAGLSLDKRDNTFLATEGYLFDVGFEQVIGTFSYPRADFDFRKYFLLRQHPDGSGRHVLSLSTRMGISGDDTPLYDHYFAGGFSTIRGFDFRGASHRIHGFTVGGHFMLLNSVEYLFPITADDTLRGVVFCDTGTVEPKIGDWTDKYRVAPGFGLRITIPAMGPAPIALDFAFPVVKEDGDDRQVFSFFVGFLR
jgi:outer membrane protein insertion porin family